MAVGGMKRSRRGVIARLAVVGAAACLATYAASRCMGRDHPVIPNWRANKDAFHRLCDRPGPRLGAVMAAEQIADAYHPKHHGKKYATGKLVECYAPKNDNEKAGADGDLTEVTIPQITLDADAVYFFDLPDVHEHEDGDGDEDSGEHDDDHDHHHHHHHHDGDYHEHPGRRTRWNTAGTFKLSASEDVDKVTVDTKISFRESLFAQVCTWERKNGAKGVGVLSPLDDPHETRVNYIAFDVKIPTKKFKHFETTLWNYTQNAGDLSKVLFKSLSLVGVNGNIAVENVKARHANATTINGNLTGTYAAQDVFQLATVNGLINVDLDFKVSSEDTGRVELHTVNGGIDVNLALGTTSDDFPGTFKVSATTANAPVVLKFTDAPAESELAVQASTVSAPANVTLHPTFEGAFLVKTFGGKVEAELDVRQGVEDPEGRGRSRHVETRPVSIPFGHGISGDVFWGDDGPERGVSRQVTVSTLFAPAFLKL